jgi:hypothetical protein
MTTMKKSTTKGTATTGAPTKKVIGTVTTIITREGMEHKHLAHHELKICAVIKGAARPDYDPDADDTYITDDETLAAAGGVTADDRCEVAPWIEAATPGIGGCEGPHWSFVCSDARAVDLEGLLPATAAPASPAPRTR